MKIVINRCYGGFSLSCAAIKRLAELQGRKCFFFTGGTGEPYKKVELPLKSEWFVSAFDTDNIPERKSWKYDRSDDQETLNFNIWFRDHRLDSRPDDRSDPLLIQVVEELGEAASGPAAKLKVVEIPDGVEYEIDEYDGIEHIAEVHRTWS